MTEQINQIPLDFIIPHPGNRRVGGFDEERLQELADSIKIVGVQQPAIVRPYGDNGQYQLVAGERRWRATRLAGLEELPCVIRDIDDVTVLKIQTIENLQREDIHPLDEADGYQRLIKEAEYDVDLLAKEVGKSISYVYQRLKLRDLAPKARQKFVDGEITAGHAILIARIPEKQQKEAIEINERYNGMSVRDLKDWIQRNVMLDLSSASFKKNDKILGAYLSDISYAGACTECSKRTGYEPALFPDIEKKDFCLDSKCFNAKLDAQLKQQKEKLKGEEYIEVCSEWNNCPKGAIESYHWEECKKKAEGAKRALIVNGMNRGRITYAREKEGYERYSDPEEKKKWEEEQRQRGLDRNTNKILNKKIFEDMVHLYESLKNKWDREILLIMLGDDRFDYWPDDYQSIFEKYNIAQKEEELDTDEILRRIGNLDNENLEMFAIESILFEGARDLYSSDFFIKFAEKKGINLEALRKQAREEAEQEIKKENK